ncbi:MAG TPA: homoserine dehydrogenase [Alphaproteobacteria bacterium]|nr:homoserine dehydrogenase [Alphaproteobacteria bacterium]
MTEIFKVALAGLGTVGGGVVKLLREQSVLLEKRTGVKIVLAAVSDLNPQKFLELGLPGEATYFKDALEMVRKADADLIVELIGGADGVAWRVCRETLERGKAFVTANKAMIAHHGNEIAGLTEEKGLFFGFEAAVAGGIPIIKSVREGFVGNNISEVYGILNGTCNYILTAMRETGKPFDEVLADAQKLGYAEADPSFDIDGVDTAHKMCILGALAFGTPINLNALSVEGIRRISALDIAFAEELGFRIKLLGVGRRVGNGVSLNVYPCMIPQTAEIAHVDGVFNAVIAEGDFVGHSMFVGRGAGEKPTASAVVSDIVDAAAHRGLPLLTVKNADVRDLPVVPLAQCDGEFYVRFDVDDRPGVVADIARILGGENVSIASMIQRGRAPDGKVPLIMTLHKSKESAVAAALEKIGLLDSVSDKPCAIRIERL